MPGPDNLPPTLRSAADDVVRSLDARQMQRLDRVRDDQQRRWRSGERVLVETYVREDPALFAHPQALLELLIAEADLRRELGESVQASEYLQRFPQHARELHLLFELDEALDTDPMDSSRATLHRGPAAETLSSTAESLTTPVVVPGFEILAELGRGGMGVVYKARHQRLNRIVALKMILTGPHAGTEEVMRFLAEAEAVARLHHPNIVPLFESGSYNGLPWFTLEYVPGGSLAKRLHGVPLPPETAARLVEQLADGVQHAHEEGILHRDLKPGNVLLDTDGTPRITDFGLAKRVDLGSGLTASGSIMGTPSYMAPEQAAGDAKHVGPSADVYALGAILYECLTGRPPFQGPSAVDVIQQVLRDEPVAPRLLVRAVPKDLETICLKCLRKDPNRRYSSAAALQEDLRRFREREPILARPVSVVERAAMWARRRPTAAALIGMALLGVLVVSAVIWEGNYLAHQAVRKTRAVELVRSLDKVETSAVLQLIERFGEYSDLTTPLLKEKLQQTSADSPEQLHVLLALLPEDASHAPTLADYVPRCTPRQVLVLCEALEPFDAVLAERLWPLVRNPEETPSRRLRAACVLAKPFSNDPRWNDVAAVIAEALLAENSLDMVHWAEALKPARAQLLPALAKLYQETRKELGKPDLDLTRMVDQASRLKAIADLLARGAADQPTPLADVLPDMDPRHYELLTKHLQANAAPLIAAMRRELHPLAPLMWDKPPPKIVDEIERAHGLVTPRFAFCQTLPLTRFDALSKALERHGYRPSRLRPIVSNSGDGETRTAAIWERDHRPTVVLHGATAVELEQANQKHTATGLRPFDVAGYRVGREERYAAIWLRPLKDEPDRQMYAGRLGSQHDDAILPLTRQGFAVPLTYSLVPGGDGEFRFSAIWARPDPSSEYLDQRYILEQSEINHGLPLDRVLTDVCVYPIPSPTPRREQLEQRLANCAERLQVNPDDAQARLNHARAMLQLGRRQEAIDDLDALLRTKTVQDVEAYSLRARIRAWQGQAADARADLSVYQDRSINRAIKAKVAAVVESCLDGGSAELQRLDELVASQSDDEDTLIEAARAYAVISDVVRRQQTPRAVAQAGLSTLLSQQFWGAAALMPHCQQITREHQTRAAQYAQRALTLLERAVAQGSLRYATLRDDEDLATLHEEPAFRDLLMRGRLDLRYAVIWHHAGRWDVESLCGLDPSTSLTRVRELIAMGFQPTSLSVAEPTSGGPLATTFVWRRPTLTREEKDRLARRKAGAAATLMHLNDAESVWPLFGHTADPNARSYLVHRVAPLGVDPLLLVQRYRKEPNITARRALLLALGEYSPDRIAADQRDALIGDLLKAFAEEPDAGLHGAIDWLLRQRWGQAAHLSAIEQRLRTSKPVENGKQWYINSQGQTFTIVQGPVEFNMGSRPSEPNRRAEEIPHRRRIPRSFAVATRPVTVAEYRCFLTEHPEFRPDPGPVRVSTDPNSPAVNLKWFEAAAYCRWLSEKEGVEANQMCYPKLEEIGEGMRLPRNVLARTGYRLLTEAEWEYACRAGAETSRFYGDSEELLEHYAWYARNSHDRTQSVGKLKPNDLGLFDMLGNAWNWPQDPPEEFTVQAWGAPVRDQSPVPYPITDRTTLKLRGGGFDVGSAFQRCAMSYPERPTRTSITIGFRIARTWKNPD